jgi:uncharacterized protein
MRNLYAFVAGSLFGVGLLVSGMTDTTKVQGWLDVFGAWDPTLAFVMGGAILPMAVAWQLTRGRRPVVGGSFPEPPKTEIGRKLSSVPPCSGWAGGWPGSAPARRWPRSAMAGSAARSSSWR